MDEKKYITDNPTLMAEWNWDKNNQLGFNPQSLTLGSNKKAWWKCDKGHEWQAIIADRNRGYACPYCKGQKVLKGYNDLATINPLLAKEWNFERNEDLKPEQFTVGSGKKVWWKCGKGHEWQAFISNRSKGIGCPYCSGRCAIVGETDLQTVNPLLAKEWDYEKNTTLTPSQVTFSSGKKVWWKCSKGHEWQASVANRNKGRGCPICTSERHTSFPEYALLYYLKKYGLETIHSYKAKGYELDIYIPSKKIAIEYDGYFWHKNKENKDLQKNKKCLKDGIQLYRIREDLSALNDSSIDYTVRNNKIDLERLLKKVLTQITGNDLEINLKKDNIAIENLRVHTEKENSLLLFNPEVAQEWNYEKNGQLKPEQVTANSNKKIWWVCKKGHEWQNTINNRNRGRNCPFCANKKILPGFNDLLTVNPTLAKEWNYQKNNGLTPMDVIPNTPKKVWWKCQKEHEWNATVNSRTQGNGCPYCSGRYVIKGENDLRTVNPVLANEWHYERNNELTPMDVQPGSNKKVWWKCKKGHEWQSIIVNRIKGHGCPYCAGQKAVTGENDLQTVNPLLVNEWDFEKNNGLTPMDVMPYSDKKVWWKCSNGHRWQAVIKSRSKGTGCPYCIGQKVLVGYNDLATLNPRLAKEWNYERNENLKPEQFSVGSNKKVWWKCNKGHEWKNAINNRNRGRNCPFCANKKILSGFNDLLTINPALAKEWNYQKNNDLTPVQVAPYSNKKVWWKCKNGNEWQARIADRS